MSVRLSARRSGRTSRIVALPVDGGDEGGNASDQQTMLASLCRQVQEQAKGIFDENIPHTYIKLLSAGRRLLYGTGLYAVAIATVAILFWFTFTKALTTETLSTTRTTANCMPVDRPTSGSFLADFSGNWANTQSFDPSPQFTSCSSTTSAPLRRR
jgi:hypothetical protein